MTTRAPFFKKILANPNRALAYLYARIEQQKKLLDQLKTVLPAHLAPHALHCVVSEKKIVIYTDSAAWATQLRFYNKIILNTINQANRNGIEILQIKISNPICSPVHPLNRTAKIPTPEQIAIIRRNATDNKESPLRQALLKLSGTLERLSEQSRTA